MKDKIKNLISLTVVLILTFFSVNEIHVFSANVEGKCYYNGTGTFRGNTDIESVTIPEGVQVIGEGAFYSCSKELKVYTDNKDLFESRYKNRYANIFGKDFDSSNVQQINNNGSSYGPGNNGYANGSQTGPYGTLAYSNNQSFYSSSGQISNPFIDGDIILGEVNNNLMLNYRSHGGANRWQYSHDNNNLINSSGFAIYDGEQSFQGRKDLKSVVINSNFTLNNDFADCENLEEIYILKGASEIYIKDFISCKKLQKIHIFNDKLRVGYGDKAKKLRKINDVIKPDLSGRRLKDIMPDVGNINWNPEIILYPSDCYLYDGKQSF